MMVFKRVVAVGAVLVGLGLVCPALAELRSAGSLAFGSVLLFMIGAAMTVAGAGGLVRAVRFGP